MFSPDMQESTDTICDCYEANGTPTDGKFAQTAMVARLQVSCKMV
jgi:hypothetical protein